MMQADEQVNKTIKKTHLKSLPDNNSIFIENVLRAYL